MSPQAGHESDSGLVSSTESTDSSGDLEEPKQLNPGWHFLMVTSAFTLGTVFAPFTLAKGGWFWGTAMWLYSYVTTWWSGVLIGKCIMEGTRSGPGCSYPDMMAEAFGQPGYWLTAFFQLATYYTFSVALMVNFADWFLLAQQVMDAQGTGLSRPLCVYEYIMVGGAIVAVLAQAPTYHRVLPLAVVSFLSTLARQLIMYYQIWTYDLASECKAEYSYGDVSAESAFISLATTAFLFGSHGMFPEEIRELHEPKSFFAALNITYVILGVVYFTNVYVAYSVWGSWGSVDIQFNYPLNTATMLSAVLSAVWGLIETALGHVTLLSLFEHHANVAHSTRPHLNRFLLRTGVVASEVVFALMLSSAGVSNLQGFLAAFGFGALDYYVPFLAYWKLVLVPRGASAAKQAVYLLMFASGVLLTVVGVYASLDGMGQQIRQYRLFDTSRCSVSDIVDLASCDNPCLAAYGFDASVCAAAP